MKIKIFIASLIYIIILVILWEVSNIYIKKKDERLRKQAYDYFDKFFSEQNTYIDTEYSNERIK